MCALLDGVLNPGARWLLVVAAPLEARAVRTALGMPEQPASVRWLAQPVGDRADLLVTGVGKANAAGALAHAFDPARHGGVLGLGVAGALPEPDEGTLRFLCNVGDAVAIDAACYADEGLLTAEGFTDIAAMGFAPGDGLDERCGAAGVRIAYDTRLTDRLVRAADRRGDAATVSTCSGTDALARAVAQRSGAAVETMESAAVAFTARRLGGPGLVLGEVRTISNFTGDRARGAWDLPAAARRLAAVTRALLTDGVWPSGQVE